MKSSSQTMTKKGAPSLRDLPGSYTQTYLVKSTPIDSSNDDEHARREVLFRCGAHCYSGHLKIDFQHAFGLTLKDIPSVVPMLQSQLDDLSYLCRSSSISSSSTFHGPLHAIESARDFLVYELSSDRMASRIRKLMKKYSWIEDETRIYFELIGNASHMFQDILFIASKVNVNGLIFNTIYFEGVVYVTMQDGSGVQPLLDINFPDVSIEGEGATLALYTGKSPWMKLSVFQTNRQRKTCPVRPKTPQKPAPRKDLSSDCYVQSYCILKSRDGSDERGVMFRFGAWCYR